MRMKQKRRQMTGKRRDRERKGREGGLGKEQRRKEGRKRRGIMKKKCREMEEKHENLEMKEGKRKKKIMKERRTGYEVDV